MKISTSTIIDDALDAVQELKTGIVNAYSHASLLNDVLQTSIDCPEKPEDYKLQVIDLNSTKLDKICLTSGGADSTIAWYKTGKPKGLYINIGQPYAEKEIMALERLGVDFEVVDVSGRDIPSWKHIIPGRNFLFLTIAAEMVKDGGEIIFSVLDGEGFNSDKGDKSARFIVQFLNWYIHISGKTVYIKTMTDNTKAGWLKWYIDSYTWKEQGIRQIRHNTVTCFSKGLTQCGECQACLRKYLSFMYNEVDIAEDFVKHPMIGAKQYVDKYKKVLGECLLHGTFNHYSRQRCIEDLKAINMAENILHG